MKQERLSHCLGNVDGKYIEEAEQYKKRKNNRVWQLAAVAACLCLVVTSALYLGNQGKKLVDDTDYTPNIVSGVYVPMLELPERVDDSVDMSMIGLVVYQSKIYTQAQMYYGEYAAAISGLVGERLGYAKGNVDEWSSQDEYATEFASSISGDVYSVNGYSTQFRLCMKLDYVDDNGKEVPVICFLEHLNGITLDYGEYLFNDRLLLSDNWDTVKYLTHQNWNTGWPDYMYNELHNISREDISAFLAALYAGEFEYNEQGIDYLDMNPSGYSEKEAEEYAAKGSSKQAHLFFFMKDGTITELRLFEGGYVSYQHLGLNYFVRIPGEAFDVIFNACQ